MTGYFPFGTTQPRPRNGFVKGSRVEIFPGPRRSGAQRSKRPLGAALGKYYPALDKSKTAGVRRCGLRDTPGEVQEGARPLLGPRVCLQTQWSVVLGLQINRLD